MEKGERENKIRRENKYAPLNINIILDPKKNSIQEWRR